MELNAREHAHLLEIKIKLDGVVYFSAKNKAGKALKMFKDFLAQELENRKAEIKQRYESRDNDYWENWQRCRDLRAVDGFDS